MRFEQPLLEGILVRRRQRFRADIKLRNGGEVTAHCANLGGDLREAVPGSRVLLSVNQDPRCRFGHEVEVIYVGRTAVGVHTGRPIGVVTEAIQANRIPEVAGYAAMERNPPRIHNHRIDVLLKGNGLRSCHIRVQSVPGAQDNIAYYPDLEVPGGVNPLVHMTNLVREGNRAMIMFIAQRNDVESFRLADHTDGTYAQAFRDAIARGVEAVCYRARVTRRGIELDRKLDVDLGG